MGLKLDACLFQTFCGFAPFSNLVSSCGRELMDTNSFPAFLATPVCLLIRFTFYYRKMMMVHLKDIVPAAQNNINTQFIVLDKVRSGMEGQKKTCLALVADETASVHFQFWGDECDAFEPGDIVRLANGIFSYNRSNLVLRAGKRGTVEKAGEFSMVFVETPNMSEIRWILDPSQSNKYVQNDVIASHSRIFRPLP